MDTKDLLNIFLIISFVLITSCIAFTTYYLIQALKSFTRLTEDIDDTTQSIKNGLQLKALAAIPAILIGLISKVIKKD